MSLHYLSSLFSPRSIAIFGATEDEGRLCSFVLRNLLIAGYQGEIYPINPDTDNVQGVKAYGSLTQVGKAMDLGVITTSAEQSLDLVRQCGEQGVKMLMILPGGFREVGIDGQRLEDQVMQLVTHYGMRLIGPNCLGIIRPTARLNLMFGNNQVQKGDLALVSQSGSICTAILDWAEMNGIGFSTLISTGVNADLDFGDYLDYLAQDPATRSILLYIEGIHNSRRFMSSLRAAARIKPVIVLKVGRHASGAKASFSHTGSLVGRDDVFSAALDRSGVVRVNTISQLFSAARVLATSKIALKGERVAIITNGGGPGVMAADRAADLNVELAALSDSTLGQLDKVLPHIWSQRNPVDLGGDASAERYRQALQICLRAAEVDAVIVILTPQAMTLPTEVARAVADIARASRKPVLVSWMGGAQVVAARRLFNEAKVPQFNTLENCIDAFSYKAAYQRTQKLLLQVPGKLKRGFPSPDKAGAQRLIDSVLMGGRRELNEHESFAVLNAFNIPTAQAGVARSVDQALELAQGMGYPVVLKVLSSKLSHKSDVGGVRLNILSDAELETAYRHLIDHVNSVSPELQINAVTVERMCSGENLREVMIGLKRDPVFGPVISFGSGGNRVEALGDIQVALPPLNRKLARDLISRTRIAKLLGPYRNMPAADLDALETVLLRLSNLACELPAVEEMDINPLIVDENGAVAVDARIKVNYSRNPEGRYDHLAIHPYPVNYIRQVTLKNGEAVTIRPIRPEDAEIEKSFVDRLSDETKYFRFLNSLNAITPQMLVRFTQIDYQDEMALVAVRGDQEDEEIGVARYAITADHESCEFAIVIASEWEHQGLAKQLMTQLIDIARERGLKTMFGEILATNRKMLSFMGSLGFSVATMPEDTTLKIATLLLQPESV